MQYLASNLSVLWDTEVCVNIISLYIFWIYLQYVMPLLINTVVAERDSVVKTRNRIKNSEFGEKSHNYENCKKKSRLYFTILPFFSLWIARNKSPNCDIKSHNYLFNFFLFNVEPGFHTQYPINIAWYHWASNRFESIWRGAGDWCQIGLAVSWESFRAQINAVCPVFTHDILNLCTRFQPQLFNAT